MLDSIKGLVSVFLLTVYVILSCVRFDRSLREGVERVDTEGKTATFGSLGLFVGAGLPEAFCSFAVIFYHSLWNCGDFKLNHFMMIIIESELTYLCAETQEVPVSLCWLLLVVGVVLIRMLKY